MVPNPLSLEAALQFAREHDPVLQAGLANVRVVASESVAARTRLFNPELEAAITRGGGSLASDDEGTLEVGIQQELELWGKRGQRRKLAAARLGTSRAEVDVLRQQVELLVRARFQRALSLQRRLTALRELTDQERRVVNSTWARVRDQSVTALTGRLTELDWLRIQRQLQRAQSEHRQAVTALELVLGGSVVEPLELLGELRADTLRVAEETAVTVALERRRESEALRLRIADREADLRLAGLDGRPNLLVAAGLARERTSFAADDFSGDPAVVGGITGLNDVDQLWQLRFSLPIPVWQRNQGARARAAAEIAQARLDLENSAFRIGMEVRAAVRAFNDAADLYRPYRERASRVRDDLALVRSAYADGRITLESYLTQKGRLVDTLVDELEAEDTYWEARGVLETATGADLATLGLGGSR